MVLGVKIVTSIWIDKVSLTNMIFILGDRYCKSNILFRVDV